MKIYNLTQHKATKEQIKDGVIDLPAEKQSKLHELLTFDTIPNPLELVCRASEISHLVKDLGVDIGFMIGGAPYFMPFLTIALKDYGIPFYSFTKRVVTEKIVDGKTIKTSTFKHEGFIEAV